MPTYNAHFFNQNFDIKTGGAHCMWVCGKIPHLWYKRWGAGCALYMVVFWLVFMISSVHLCVFLGCSCTVSQSRRGRTWVRFLCFVRCPSISPIVVRTRGHTCASSRFQWRFCCLPLVLGSNRNQLKFQCLSLMRRALRLTVNKRPLEVTLAHWKCPSPRE